MSVANVYDCCCKTSLSATSRSESSGRSPPLSASATPPELRFQSIVLGSPTCFTSQAFSHRGRLSPHPSAFLYSLDKEKGQCTLASRNLGTLKYPVAGAAVGKAAGRVDEDSTPNCLYLKRTIHNGEVVEHSGTVVIFGDVEPGGQVLADGHVIVLGRLQGHVHAGRAGDVTSRIFATSMEPKELRIWESPLSYLDHTQTNIPKMAALSTNCSISVFPAAEEPVEKQNLPLNRAGTFHNGQVRLRNRGPAQVALITGIYISVAGIALLGFPKVLFGVLFDLQGVNLGWVRVIAILAVVFGVYYIGTAIGDMRGMHGAEAFYLSTVVGRTFLFLSFSWLVLMGAVPSPLLLVGAVNLVGAMLMLKALLRSPAPSSR